MWQHCWRSGFPAGNKTSFLLVTQEARAGGTGPSVPRLVLPLPACSELPRSDVSSSSRHCFPLGEAPKHLEPSPCLQRLMGRADFQVRSFAQKWVSRRAGRRQPLQKQKFTYPAVVTGQGHSQWDRGKAQRDRYYLIWGSGSGHSSAVRICCPGTVLVGILQGGVSSSGQGFVLRSRTVPQTGT